MSSEDEKAAIQARLYESIKREGPGWQEASLSLFLLKASELEPPATPPVIYLPSAVTSEADTDTIASPGTKTESGAGSAATPSGYINT
jgi:hypothetical protein